jgi:L-methionine (R)-S-oxide reductase
MASEMGNEMAREMAAAMREILARQASREEKAAQIAKLIRDAGGYRWVGIYDVDAGRREVRNVAWCGPNAPVYLTFPATQGLTSRAIAQKKSINVGDVGADKDYLTALGDTRSEIIVPILSAEGAQVIGTIDAESEDEDAFDAEAQRWLEECARVMRAFWAGDDS